MTDQYKLTSIVCVRSQQFAWFLGAGASAGAGLPTAWDVIWDLKRRYYRREENQDISRQDMQLDAVRSRVQSYMLSKGFAEEGSPGEYTTYFERDFGDDKEKQRQYLAAILSEKNVTLSIGNRILGALLASGGARSAFFSPRRKALVIQPLRAISFRMRPSSSTTSPIFSDASSCARIPERKLARMIALLRAACRRTAM